MINRVITTGAILTISAFMVGNVYATSILGSNVSSAQGSYGGDYDIQNAVNQSGLSSTYVSGVTDFDAFVASTTHDGSNSLNSGFLGSTVPPGQFTFDLGFLATTDGFAFWDTQNSGSLTNFNLYADTDNDFSNGGTTFIGNFTPTGGGFSGLQPSSAQVFGYDLITTQFLHIDILGMQGGTDLYPGIGEIAFREATAPVPEPATMFLIGAGIAGLAGIRSRRKQK